MWKKQMFLSSRAHRRKRGGWNANLQPKEIELHDPTNQSLDIDVVITII
jgi:hypothetical protein